MNQNNTSPPQCLIGNPDSRSQRRSEELPARFLRILEILPRFNNVDFLRGYSLDLTRDEIPHINNGGGYCEAVEILSVQILDILEKKVSKNGQVSYLE